MDLEVTDWVSRFQRLTRLQGVAPPMIEEVTLPADRVPGATRAIPVIRVTFDERDFFAPGSAEPRSQAVRILAVMAENMHRDVPDVRVTVLGHTDVSGLEAENLALSKSRALSVVRSLVGVDVNPGQLSVVAIGSGQPIAPNSTADGRARNRRVEFLISPNEQANLAVISLRSINPAFLVVGGATEPSIRRSVVVLRPAYAGPVDFSEAPGAPPRKITLAASETSVTIGQDVSGSPVLATTTRSAGRESGTVDAESGSPVASTSASFKPERP
jgi:outer membrane protein OmpA-like peptidoglycan-associated protein